MISENSVVVRDPNLVSSDLGEETVILHRNSGKYYILNPVAVSIWKLIQEPRSVSKIRDAILDEYDVVSDECMRDILSLLRQLEFEGLIEVKIL